MTGYVGSSFYILSLFVLCFFLVFYPLQLCSHMAPEVLFFDGTGVSDADYDEKIDIFSLGAVYYYLAFHSHAFASMFIVFFGGCCGCACCLGGKEKRKSEQ